MPVFTGRNQDPMAPADMITPMVGELGIAGLGGFCVGYAIKKVTRIVAALAAVFFMGVQYLSYIGIVEINQTALQDWVNSALTGASTLQEPFLLLLSQASLGAGFAAGLVLGLKKG
jgi:uncharacterized membrane protein (Fun14 family)